MNYKPFDLEQAKAGKPVITRDGSPARIVCWDRKSKYPLFGFVGKRDEHTCSWDEKGKTYDTHTTDFDLFMAPKEKTLWVNLWRKDGRIIAGEDTYGTKEAATDWITPDPDHVGSVILVFSGRLVSLVNLERAYFRW